MENKSSDIDENNQKNKPLLEIKKPNDLENNI